MGGRGIYSGTQPVPKRQGFPRKSPPGTGEVAGNIPPPTSSINNGHLQEQAHSSSNLLPTSPPNAPAHALWWNALTSHACLSPRAAVTPFHPKTSTNITSTTSLKPTCFALALPAAGAAGATEA